ncbi:hypothetical protein ACMGDM_08505 [Sphingomonas sp. DT-51]|uniref:hypothetical protein n=1 Tax=Sphingomonas sp. DT-51 TaxID=3396165 RepID=UPI003F1AE340
MGSTQRRQVAAEALARDPLEHEPEVLGQSGAQKHRDRKGYHRPLARSAQRGDRLLSRDAVAGDLNCAPDMLGGMLQ